MRKVLTLAVVALLCASTAHAAVRKVEPTKLSGREVVTFQHASLATNAIDTLVVYGVNPKILWLQVAAAANTDSLATTAPQGVMVLGSAFEGIAGTGGSGTVDSCQVAIDASFDGLNWIELSALTSGLHTNAAPNLARRIKVSTTQKLKAPPSWFRLRAKNTGAATGKGTVTLIYETP